MDERPTSNSDLKREMLRHALATLAYRGAKVVEGAPEGFDTFRASDTTRSAGEILGHLGDLVVWARMIAKGDNTWSGAAPMSWDEQVSRFFTALSEFDSYLASDAPMAPSAERLFQAPIADALTHVGQLAILRRIAGSPIRAENYFKADIVAGRVGLNQSKDRVEFD